MDGFLLADMNRTTEKIKKRSKIDVSIVKFSLFLPQMNREELFCS